ncbi:BTB/POZ domain-containing protein KCTD4-like [Babylonia areolata]|uniref:BTB/POZ domain-containing protein KCTD4-like n=1 Tax=Babylonia areolata TaxID=304850 RepID=UPI003FD220D2
MTIVTMSRHRNSYENRDNNKEVLRLNVGGSFYTTTRSTFLRHPASLLARIATGHVHVPRDDRNFLVIDRDGNVFRHILNYLRTDRLLLPDGFREVALLREEALYYELPGLVADLDGMLENRRRQMRRGGGNFRGRNNHHAGILETGGSSGGGGGGGGVGAGRKMSASVGDLHLLQEEDDLDFIEDSWIGGTLQ